MVGLQAGFCEGRRWCLGTAFKSAHCVAIVARRVSEDRVYENSFILDQSLADASGYHAYKSFRNMPTVQLQESQLDVAANSIA
jgi:hypothetical protein